VHFACYSGVELPAGRADAPKLQGSGRMPTAGKQLEKMCLILRASQHAIAPVLEATMKSCLLGVVVATSLTLPAFGQSREQLVGAWTLVSCNAATPFCSPNNPDGIIIFDASGRYAVVIAARDRSKFTDVNRGRAALPAEEYKAAAMGFAANFGTWSFNEANKTLTMSREGALFPNTEGVNVTATISNFSEDELKSSDGNGWRRVRR
jgi:hypothetical protein